jgi:hypothetical protein
MTISMKRVLPLALAVCAVGAMALASAANAAHQRPLVAPKIVTNLVPAFEECTSSNGFHGPPLGGPSCNPPVPTSAALETRGKMVASGKLKVVGDEAPPEDSDVTITLSASDVRCDNDGTGDSTACGSANTTPASSGADYAGILVAQAMIRISDHFNAPTPGGGTDNATVIDLPFAAGPITCAGTPGDATVGSTCSITTSADTLVPADGGAVKDGKRGVVEIQQIEVIDGGVSGTSPTDRFLVQGLFIP